MPESSASVELTGQSGVVAGLEPGVRLEGRPVLDRLVARRDAGLVERHELGPGRSSSSRSSRSLWVDRVATTIRGRSGPALLTA